MNIDFVAAICEEFATAIEPVVDPDHLSPQECWGPLVEVLGSEFTPDNIANLREEQIGALRRSFALNFESEAISIEHIQSGIRATLRRWPVTQDGNVPAQLGRRYTPSAMSQQNTPPANPDDDLFYQQLTAYRQSLVAAEQSMQSEYDKAVMALSGGALGISFTFLKDIIGTKGLIHYSTLLGAWILWGLSISFILASFFTSTKALRKAVTDTDMHTVYMTLAKSPWATATKILNALGGICFFLGLVALVIFVAHNQPK
ncbi:hypothetical protein ACXR0O_25475 [Verrucomicrobiota bacterium sgz303538]